MKIYSILKKYGLSGAFVLASVLSLLSIAVMSSNSISYTNAYQNAQQLDEVKKETDADKKNELLRSGAKNIVEESQVIGVGTLIMG
jgi:predicted Mrr-cat superfamily restriction endonuclease